MPTLPTRRIRCVITVDLERYEKETGIKLTTAMFEGIAAAIAGGTAGDLERFGLTIEVTEE